MDLIAPMAYHAILHQPPGWVGEVVQSFASSVPGQVLPVLQVDSAEGAEAGADWGPPVPPGEWEEVVQQALDVHSIRGLVAFTGTALLRNGRGERLQASLAPT